MKPGQFDNPIPEEIQQTSTVKVASETKASLDIKSSNQLDSATLDTKPKSNKPEEETKYTIEAAREEIRFKAAKIRAWAEEQGWKEDDDYKIFENLSDAVPEGENPSFHEKRQFAVVIRADHYEKFKNYLLSRYKQERKLENPKGDVKFNYSWAGRVAVGWDGVPFDTGAVESMQTGAKSHHQEFKNFFRNKTGVELPSAEQLNAILHEISDKGLDIYEQQYEKIKELRQGNKIDTLPDYGEGLEAGLNHTINILRKAKKGQAVQELPEMITVMPESMRWYADLTYNAEDIKDYSQLAKITGIPMPDDIRIDKIYDRLGFDPKKVEEICKDFSEYLEAKRKIK